MKIYAIKKALPRLKEILENCTLCPRNCKVDRIQNKKGYCKAGQKVAVYSYGPHHGEEPVLSGTRGSGTIFFTHCNMSCCYCQNYQFSQLSDKEEIELDTLAGMMLSLQGKGCHNINLVSPTHYVPQIVEALGLAARKGLRIPIVYNTGGYDSLETIELLNGIVDIYMPDMRYSDDAMAEKYSNAPGYAENNRLIIKEMHRQIGELELDKNGIAVRGLIIRLLVLPQGISGTDKTLEFIKKETSQNTYISLMSQYYPTYRASEFKEINRRIYANEYKTALDAARKLGLENGWIQGAALREMDLRFAGHRIKPGKIKF